MLTGEVLWFAMGAAFVIVVLGARAWTRDLGLSMTWWKWLLALAWYGLLLFSIALGFTLVGEQESGAGLRFLALFGVITAIFGVGLIRILWSGRRERRTDA